MKRHTIPREIHVDDGARPLTIYLWDEEQPPGGSGCLMLILVGILLILLLSLVNQGEVPLGALVLHVLV